MTTCWTDEPKDLRSEDAFDVEAVHAWLAARLDGSTRPPTVRQYGGGASNLTMATLGDPHMDLGGALAYWVQADDDAGLG